MISSDFGEEIDAISQYEQHRSEAAKTARGLVMNGPGPTGYSTPMAHDVTR